MGRHRTFGNVRKLPSGRYQARYLDPSGHRHRAPRTFATGADANRWLSATAALRYQHATRDRDVVIARALNEVIEAGRATVSSEIDE